ncbi:MAG: putative toxin-antitoxin system toxin component, PIN family [Gammaproteobacteria bacterium]|nr:putative toxin-antitoxin system toxin component, PIN family [Gammaproteobacteria bacterium]
MEPESAGCTQIVIDTNVALDLLVFDDPSCAALKADLEAGRARWLATEAMRDEFARVLDYPHIARRLSSVSRHPADVLTAFDALIEPVAERPPRARCVCTDPDDQMFVDLAVARKAGLLSKDRAVLALRRRLAEVGVWVRPGA